MDKRLLGVTAVILGIIGMLLQIGSGVLRVRLTGQELPSWAVFGTVGTSITAYTYALELAVPVLTVGIAVGVGYYVGRQYAVAGKVRSFIRTVALGSAFGVSLSSLVILWPELTSIGDSGFGMPTSQAQEMLVLDIVLPAVVLLRYLAEVALIITVGMFAGAALAQLQWSENSPDVATPAETDVPSESAQTSANGSTESDLQPAQ